MALPLIMMAGAGILSGAQYLLKRQDEKKGETMLADFQSDIYNGPMAGTQMGDWYANQAQQAVSTRSGFFDEMATPRLEELQNAYGTQLNTMQQNQQAAQASMADRFSQTNTGIANTLSNQYNADLKVFAETQNQFKSAMNALDNPSNLNSVTALYNMFNLIEPGGRVTQNEDGTFSGAGDVGNRFSNWLNEMQGEGLTPDTIEEIRDAIWQQYSQRYEQSVRRKQYYEDEMNKLSGEGRNVRSPIGRLGIDWSLNQMPNNEPVIPIEEQPAPPGFSLTRPGG